MSTSVKFFKYKYVRSINVLDNKLIILIIIVHHFTQK